MKRPKLKILYVGGTTASERGAVGTHTAGVLRALDGHPNVELHGVFLSYAKPFYLPERTRLLDLPVPRRADEKVRGLLRYARYVRRMRRELGDVATYVRFEPFLCPTIVNERTCIEYNDVFLEQIDIVARKGGWTPFGRWMRTSRGYQGAIQSSERYTFRRARLVVAVTNGLLDYCKKVCPSVAGLVVHNASDASPVDIRVGIGSEDELRLAHVGTLTHWDGLHELISAIAIARQRKPTSQIRLKVVGEGAIRDDLVRQVRELALTDVVSFHPPVSQAEARAAVEGADVVPLLKTIDSYGLSPIKYYEALALGRTVIVSDIPHINEGPAFTSRVVKFPLDVAEIAGVLLELHANRERIRAAREEIAGYAQAVHTWDARVAALVAAMRD